MEKPGQSTVEPVFGSPAKFYGLRKIGVPGKAGAHKVMLMAAIASDLKKYLKKGEGDPPLAFPGPSWIPYKAARPFFAGKSNQDRFSKRLSKNSLLGSISYA